MSHPYRGGDASLVVGSANLGQQLMDLLRGHFEFLQRMFGGVKRKTILEDEVPFIQTAAFTRLQSCCWEFKEWFGYSCRASRVNGVQYVVPHEMKSLRRANPCRSLGHALLHGQPGMIRVRVREASFFRAARFELRGELPFGKDSQFDPCGCRGCLEDQSQVMERHLFKSFQGIPVDEMTLRIIVCSFEEVLCCLSYFGTEEDVRRVKAYGSGLPDQKSIPAYKDVPRSEMDRWRETELGGAEDLLQFYLRGNIPLGRDVNQTMLLLTAGFSR